MNWRTQLRAVLGVVVLLLVGGVAWYATRQQTAVAPPPESPRKDAKCDTELSGTTQERHDDAGKLVFRMKYDYGCTIDAENSLRFVNVTGNMARGDQPVEFKADEAILKLKSGAMMDFSKFDEIRMRGGVVIKAGKELYLETSEATYNDITGIMETTKAVKIRRGRMSGSGIGATFDRGRSVVWLLADAKVSIATEGQGTLSVTSARAGLAELEHYMRFEERVRMDRDGRVIETDAAVANLTPEGDSITSLELRGNSRITGAPASGGGGVPNMSADDITITYGAETGLLERSVLMRNARLDLPEGGGRSLAAGYIDIGFGGDGTTVTVLDANETVVLQIPAEKDLPSREVKAPKLEARGAAPKGLETATFSGGVEFREQLPARGKEPALDRIVKSATLVLGLDGGFDAIKDADFSGGARFRDADVYAEAPNATYTVDKKYIALRGGAATARVVQDDGTIEAKEIDLTLEPRKIAARADRADSRDRVKTTLNPGARKDRKEPRPSLLEDDQPVHITARTLDYDGVAERATYVGDARLWQGDTSIQGETIVLDDKTGNLDARKKPGAALPVRTLFIIREEPLPGGKPSGPPKPTQGSGDELIYDESRRQATFRGNARLEGPDGNIRGERIELFLQEDGNTLDRAEAYEKVSADLGKNRRATGDRLTYNAKTRVYDMKGRPLKVTQQSVEKGQPRCEETVGASLTFDRSADTFLVSGEDKAPSRSVPCAAK